MATSAQGSGSLRRGLPRVHGGEPWPAEGIVAVSDAEIDAGEHDTSGLITAQDGSPAGAGGGASAQGSTPGLAQPDAGVAVALGAGAVVSPDAGVAESSGVASEAAAASGGVRLRQGLPREAGGAPWPPTEVAPVSSAPVSSAPVGATASIATPAAADAVPAAAAGASHEQAHPMASDADETASAATATAVTSAAGGALRRGLPRIDGGEPWPPAGTVVARASAGLAAGSATAQTAHDTQAEPGARVAHIADAVQSAPAGRSGAGAEVGAGAPNATVAPAARASVPNGASDSASAAAVQAAPAVRQALTLPRTAWNGRAPRILPAADEQPGRPRPTWVQTIGGLFAVAGLAIVVVAVVFLTRAVLSTPPLQDFLGTYPGDYEPAIAVEPGFAPWIGWQHFFNMFLMVLIIRSGLHVRTQKRPTAFWTPKGKPKGKISLTLWFHQALDLLWIINGVIFVVLLFVTGHWARIVPTSWEVIPNALSAGLQYVSLDWPHENGWNNYNSLQQLAYFTTVFIAAPLAIITGYRMSGLWPKKAERLSKAYPIEWARALHFPVMLYFVAFIVVHVALVMFTGFQRNLGHMYASTDVVGWTGFWVFMVSLVVIAGAWFAARPLVIAPIAKLFGQVSSR